RHGDGPRGGAPARLARGVAEGRGTALQRRGGHGQALGRGGGDEDHDRRHPGPRGLRLHQGIPGGAALPRCEDHADLRGHLADPEARHRAPAPGGDLTRRTRKEDETMTTGKERWREETYTPLVKRAPGRDVRFESLSGIPIQPLYTPEDLAGWTYEDKLGYPGEFPYTRGPYPPMYP